MAKKTKRIFDENRDENLIRINKYLSDTGFCSRRQADVRIERGEVFIDGEKALIGSKISAGQKVTVSGRAIEREDKLVLIVLNKPKGIVCTTDRREPDNVIDFLNYNKRIYPIGRLDKESEGLLLLTNDGNIVNKILRAGNVHEKEYLVKINKPIDDAFIESMSKGVPILDTVTKPCFVEKIDKTGFRIILTQGLNRQIRRMCEYLGCKVLELKRVRIMNIRLGRLKTGDYRNVTDAELLELKELIRESKN